MDKNEKKKRAISFRWLRNSISMKVSFVLLCMIVFVFSITGTVIYSYSKSLLVENIETELSTKSDAIAAQVDHMFSEKGALIKQFATNQQVAMLLETADSRNDVQSNLHFDGVMETLDQIVKGNDEIAMAWIASSKGNFLIGNDNLLSAPDFDITNRPWYQPALEKDDIYYTEPYMDEVFGKIILSIMKPIKIKDQPVGFVAIDLFLDQLPEIMKSYKLGNDGYSILLSDDGTILYHPNQDLVLNEKLQEIEGELGQIGSRMIGGEKGLTSNHNDDGQEEYIGYSPVPTTNWSVATAIPKKEAMAILDSFSITMLLLFGISCLILSIIVFLLLKYLLRALPRITSRMKLLASGDLSQVEIETTSNDEIGQLVESTNQMNHKVRDLLHKISIVSETVSTQSEELTQSANEVTAGSEQISSTMQEISVGAESQADQTSELSNIMDTFTNKVQDADEKGENITHSSEKVLLLTNKGSSLMKLSTEEMAKINQVFREIVDKVEKLNAHSQRISKLVLIIKEIADQTNLLALNAAIEAARAGENGRGFAVVADEVRKLAEQVANSVAEITGFVQDIQTESGSVTQSLTEGYREVENGTKQIEMTEQTFIEIQDAVNQMVHDIQGISGILADVAVNSQEMNDTVQDIAAFSEETAAGVEQVSATSQQTTSSMEAVASSSDELAESAEELNELIHQFKL